ncbi:hypothetical protein ACP70R_031600 [Stipagrostis hirtigluma subsp. patula]
MESPRRSPPLIIFLAVAVFAGAPVSGALLPSDDAEARARPMQRRSLFVAASGPVAADAAAAAATARSVPAEGGFSQAATAAAAAPGPQFVDTVVGVDPAAAVAGSVTAVVATVLQEVAPSAMGRSFFSFSQCKLDLSLPLKCSLFESGESSTKFMAQLSTSIACVHHGGPWMSSMLLPADHVSRRDSSCPSRLSATSMQ